MREIANYLGIAGMSTLAITYVWSFVLASRASRKVFWWLLLCWPVGYSRLTKMDSGATRTNSRAMIVGLLLCMTCLAILAVTK